MGCPISLAVVCFLGVVAHHPAAAKEFVFQGNPSSQSASSRNTKIFNEVLAGLRSGDSVLIKNETYWLAGGVRGSGLDNVTIQLDGTLKFRGYCAAISLRICPKKRTLSFILVVMICAHVCRRRVVRSTSSVSSSSIEADLGEILPMTCPKTHH